MKRIILAACMAVCTITVACNKSDYLPAIEGVTDPIEGYVRDNSGKAVSNIAVSDGYTTVRTDKNGYYKIPSRSAYSYWVYYSIPADAAIEPGTDGRPCFYKKIERGTTRYDFRIRRQAVENNFRILAIGDPQVRASNKGLQRFGNETAPDIKAYVESKNGDMPTYAVALGDFVHNEWATYPDIMALLSVEKLGVPCFCVIGNHDHEFGSATAPISDIRGQRLYEKAAGPVNYSFERGNVHCVVIDNIIHEGKTEASCEEGIAEHVDKWLRDDLSTVERSKTVLVFAHAVMRAEDFPELYALLAEFAEARIIAGHSHSVRNYIETVSGKEIYMQIVGTANGVDWKGTVCGDGAPMGYSVLEIKNGHVTNNIYKPTCMDESFQMRMYKANAFAPFSYSVQGKTAITYKFTGQDNPASVCVNVWNKTDKWTFDVYEDNVRKGTLAKVNDYDCWSVYWFYKVKGSNTYSYNQRCDHMYNYVMQNTAAKLRIVAHDEYGNTFEQTEFTGPGAEFYPDAYR